MILVDVLSAHNINRHLIMFLLHAPHTSVTIRMYRIGGMQTDHLRMVGPCILHIYMYIILILEIENWILEDARAHKVSSKSSECPCARAHACFIIQLSTLNSIIIIWTFRVHRMHIFSIIASLIESIASNWNIPHLYLMMTLIAREGTSTDKEQLKNLIYFEIWNCMKIMSSSMDRISRCLLHCEISKLGTAQFIKFSFIPYSSMFLKDISMNLKEFSE